MSVVDWKQQFLKLISLFSFDTFDEADIKVEEKIDPKFSWSLSRRHSKRKKKNNMQNVAQGIFQTPASTCFVKAENTRLNSTGSSCDMILFAIPPMSNPWGNVHHLRAWKVATAIKNQDDMRHLLLFNESFNVLHCFVLYNHSLCSYIWGSESKQPFCCSAHLWL